VGRIISFGDFQPFYHPVWDPNLGRKCPINVDSRMPELEEGALTVPLLEVHGVPHTQERENNSQR